MFSFQHIFVTATVLILTFQVGDVAGAMNISCVGHLFNNARPSDESVTKLFVRRDRGRVQLNVPPRLMWGWGGTVTGFCGSASLQSAALYYGSWISQQLPRWQTDVHIGDGSTNSDFAWLTDLYGLEMDHFGTRDIENPQADVFLEWAQDHFFDGHVVIGTAYARFHRNETDPLYDHIVPLIGVTMDSDRHQYSNWSLFSSVTINATTNATIATTNLEANVTTNVTGVLYNDLHEPEVRLMAHPLVATREQIVLPDNVNTTFPILYALPKASDFGIAIVGVLDLYNETFRTKLTAWSWMEPDWSDEDRCNEEPALLNLSIAVFGLKPGTQYSILRFDGNGTVPIFNFLAGNYSKRWDFVATSEMYSASPFDTVMTNTMASYRTVATYARPPIPSTAPFAVPDAGHSAPPGGRTFAVAITVTALLLSFGAFIVLMFVLHRRNRSTRAQERSEGEATPLLAPTHQPRS